ncbi:DUF748 domain-containing protein [Parvibium lacunae]|nr:DUF748 domain-containing protein [Parvibium lacunae]
MLRFPRCFKQLLRRAGWVALCLVLGGAGALAAAKWWLPDLIRQQIIELGEKKLGRPLDVGAVDLDLLRLQLKLHELKVLPPASRAHPSAATPAPTLAIQAIALQLDIGTLWRLTPIIRQIQIQAPEVNLSRDAAGRLSISDILEHLRAQPASPTPAFSVSNLEIYGGKIDYTDALTQKRQIISDLVIAVPLLANQPRYAPVWVTPKMQGQLNGNPFELNGKLLPFSTAPQATLTLEVKQLALGPLLQSLPLALPYQLQQGELNGTLTVHFQAAQSGKTSRPAAPATPNPTGQLQLQGELRFSDLTIQQRQGTQWRAFTQVEELALTIDTLDVWQQRAALKIDAHSQNLAATVNPVLAAFGVTPNGALPLIQRGRASIRGAVDISWATAPIVKLRDGSVEISQLLLAAPTPVRQAGERPRPMLQLARLTLQEMTADTQAKQVAIGAISQTGAQFDLQRAQNGQWNWSIAKPEVTASAPPRLPAKDAVMPPSEPWRIRIGAIELAQNQVRLTDWRAAAAEVAGRSANPSSLLLNALQLQTGPIILGGPNPTPTAITLSTGLGQLMATGQAPDTATPGKLSLQGSLNLTNPTNGQFEAQLELKQFPLVPLRAYLSDWLDCILAQGQLSSQGNVGVVWANRALSQVSYTGQLSLTQLRALDSREATDLLKWEALTLSQLALNVPLANPAAPVQLAAGQLQLSDFYGRIGLTSTGQLTLRSLLKNRQAEPQGPVSTTAAATAPTTIPAANAPAQIRLGGIQLTRGAIQFSDQFIQPNYRANLTQLNGRISALASDNPQPALVDIRGMVDDHAPLVISGTIQPLGPQLWTDIQAQAQGIELPNLTPYATKYIGYPIEKGKLSATLQYKIQGGRLEASNRLVLEQLTFGERVESPTATKLPVLLAVALLKNRRGEIDINLPIQGSLNDPEFRVGALVWQVLGNLIVKAVTAPFALIGSLFGGGEELAYIDFEPGQSGLTPAALKKLTSLAQALQDRPGLNLDISSEARPEDLPALRQALLQQQLKALKIRQLATQGQTIDPEQVTVTAEERLALMERLYQETIAAKAKPGLKMPLNWFKKVPAAELETQLLQQINIDKSGLQALAQRRSAMIRGWLATQGVPLSRLFILAPKVTDSTVASEVAPPRATFQLR